MTYIPFTKIFRPSAYFKIAHWTPKRSWATSCYPFPIVSYWPPVSVSPATFLACSSFTIIPTGKNSGQLPPISLRPYFRPTSSHSFYSSANKTYGFITDVVTDNFYPNPCVILSVSLRSHEIGIVFHYWPNSTLE